MPIDYNLLITMENQIRGERIPFPKDEQELAYNRGIARAADIARRMNTGISYDVKRFIFEGLLVDGAHHKQYYLEQSAMVLKIDMDELKHEALRTNDRVWDKGIAP